MFKGLSNLANVVKQAQQIGGRMQEMSEELKHKRTEGTAGGGMVKVEINGLQEVLAVTIEQELVDGKDRELLEDLVAAAVNAAIGKSKQLHAEAMKSLSGGIELPGLDDAIARFTGAGPESDGGNESDDGNPADK